MVLDRIHPVQFVWDAANRVMRPQERFNRLCDRQYQDGELYALGPVEDIDNVSRGKFMKAIKMTWENLPAKYKRFPSPEHLRKAALVGAGWCNQSHDVFDSVADAKRHADGIRNANGYAVIVRSGCVVDVRIARSIAAGQITAEKWREVRPRALDWASEQINVAREAVEREVGGI